MKIQRLSVAQRKNQIPAEMKPHGNLPATLQVAGVYTQSAKIIVPYGLNLLQQVLMQPLFERRKPNRFLSGVVEVASSSVCPSASSSCADRQLDVRFDTDHLGIPGRSTLPGYLIRCMPRGGSQHANHQGIDHSHRQPSGIAWESMSSAFRPWCEHPRISIDSSRARFSFASSSITWLERRQHWRLML